MASVSLGLLLASLVAVVALAKSLTPAVEAGIAWIGMPKVVVGIVIAAVVLASRMPGRRHRGSGQSLADQPEPGVGVGARGDRPAIPAVAVVSIVLGQPLALGLDDTGQTLLVLTLIVSVITLGTGRTTVLQGIVRLVIFAVFLFFAAVP